MRKTRISTSLEAIVAQTLFRIKRDGITTSYRDRLAIELLSDRSTFAYQLLEMLIGESGINVILRRVERTIDDKPLAESDMPECHYESIYDSISLAVSAPCISTVHILHYIASDPSTAIATELKHYGIISDDIACAVRRLCDDVI